MVLGIAACVQAQIPGNCVYPAVEIRPRFIFLPSGVDADKDFLKHILCCIAIVEHAETVDKQLGFVTVVERLKGNIVTSLHAFHQLIVAELRYLRSTPYEHVS
jgi:hypothetical protein